MKKAFIKRGELVEELGKLGISEKEVRKLIVGGAIKTLRLPGDMGGPMYFSWAQVERDVIRPMKEVAGV